MPRKKTTKKDLLMKGWKKQEIIKAAKIMKEAAEARRHVHQKLDKFVYITAMIILIMCNFLGILILTPMIILFNGVELYLIIALFGVLFGVLFNFLIHSIEHLGDRHHIIAGIIIPMISLVDILLLMRMINKLSEMFDITVEYSPTIIIALFVAVFIIPYLFDVIRGKHTFE